MELLKTYRNILSIQSGDQGSNVHNAVLNVCPSFQLPCILLLWRLLGGSCACSGFFSSGCFGLGCACRSGGGGSSNWCHIAYFQILHSPTSSSRAWSFREAIIQHPRSRSIRNACRGLDSPYLSAKGSSPNISLFQCLQGLLSLFVNAYTPLLERNNTPSLAGSFILYINWTIMESTYLRRRRSSLTGEEAHVVLWDL